MKNKTLRIALMIGLSGLALSANSATYRFTDLGTLGGARSNANAINNAGQVVGTSQTTGNSNHATLWNGTTPTDLGTLGGTNSEAYGINDASQVVGYSDTGFNNTHATIWNGTTPSDLGALAGYYNFANAINDAGQVVGAANLNTYEATLWSEASSTDFITFGEYTMAKAINNSGQIAGSSTFGTSNGVSLQAMLWNGTTATILGTLGGTDSYAYGINDAGQVVGASQTTGNATYQATIWKDATAIALDTLGGSNSHAYAINSAGQVVGFAYTADNTAQHAALWSGTNVFDLNSFLDESTINAGWVLTEATGINDNGWIVGNASNSLLGFQQHAFLLSVSAVPEPKTYGMILLGLGLMGVTLRRWNIQ